MPLSIGQKLGPYEILALIGKGGMGEVYRAHDSRLRRDVAIKVSNAEFSERFTREARTIASLNHTNICHLYDVGPNYLVMEYVEGADLKGPLEFDDALPIINQLIDGIEAAHEKNIIHRDLKPANIKITPEGVVKILDFGLAKAMEPPPSADGSPDNSPTLTMGATQAGAILGTAAYMSPEQAKGKIADRRADIWSFGIVLCELLSGKKVFSGESVVEVLGGVLNREPDLSAVPPRAHRLLRWCLEKDRKQRLQSIGDARRLLLEELPVAAPAITGGAGKGAVVGGKGGWVVAAVVTLLAIVAGYGWWSATRPVARPLTRLSVDLGPEAIRGPRYSAAISPDGTRIVFTGHTGPTAPRRLFTRRLDQTVITPLAGTDFATQPFFSPDGEWIGFFINNRILKVAAQGGSAVTVGQMTGASLGASWGEDGNIIVGSIGGLFRLPAGGGTPQPVTEKTAIQVFPQILPGARAVLFNAENGADNPSGLEGLDIDVLRFDTGEKKTLLHGGYFPRYLATNGTTGHIVYMHEGTLFGVAFDSARLEIRGVPSPLLEDVAASSDTNTGGGQFAFSDTGTFVYLSGQGGKTVTFPTLWMDAAGKTEPLLAQAGAYSAPRLSPDGKQLAYASGANVWVYDMQRDTPTQLTFTSPGAREVAWSPDAKHLVFGDGQALWWIRADGSGQPKKLLDQSAGRPFSFASDGRLAFAQSAGGLPDIWTLPLDLSDPENLKPGKAEPFLVEPQVVEVDPAFSPDGKFVAYSSNESGAEEVFVRPFPGPGGKWKISTAGGKFSAWSRSTRELFFLAGDEHIWVVNYTVQGDAFSAGKPRMWSPTPVRRDSTRQNFDISADGKRAVVFPAPTAVDAESSLHLTFLLNFFDEVRRRIPPGK